MKWEDISERPWQVEYWELWGEVSHGASQRVWCRWVGQGRVTIGGGGVPYCIVNSGGAVFQSGIAWASLTLSKRDG